VGHKSHGRGCNKGDKDLSQKVAPKKASRFIELDMEMKNSEWKTSVNELLSIFRHALLAVIPWIEKAQIRW
jgi:hypothetical protein